MFLGFPNEANHLLPFLKIVGTTAIVSTILIIVGHPYSPIKARKGDVVLLSPACSSFDMFEDYIDRGNQFKSIVKKLEG